MAKIKWNKDLLDEMKAMAISVGLSAYAADDAVQDAYLKLYATDMVADEKGEPNRGYLYLTVRSCAIDIIRQEKQYVDWIDSYNELEDDDSDERWNAWLDASNEAVESLHWYDKKVIKAYVLDGHTIRSLAGATGISVSSLFNSIKYVKEYVRDYVDNKMRKEN